MRIFGMAVLVVCFILCGCNGENKGQSTQPQSTEAPKPAGPTAFPEGLAKAVFQALKSKNFEGLTALIATEDDFAAFLTKIGVAEEKLEEQKQKWVKTKQKNAEEYRKTYAVILEKLNWEDAQYQTAIYQLEAERDGKQESLLDEIMLVVSCGGKKYGISMPTCLNTTHGWSLGVEFLEWKGELENK